MCSEAKRSQLLRVPLNCLLVADTQQYIIAQLYQQRREKANA